MASITARNKGDIASLLRTSAYGVSDLLKALIRNLQRRGERDGIVAAPVG